MGVGVRIVSENLNPEPGMIGKGKPKWRQKTMTENLSVGRLEASRAMTRGSGGPSSRRRRGRRGGGRRGVSHGW